jgi:uncharacterized protein Yka (UPF0111/DUF47 family)
MFSLQSLFGRKDPFQTLLAASAAQARTSVAALHGLLSGPASGDASLEAFAASRRQDKQITQQLEEALCRTFVTQLEREDIEALSKALYRIPKTAEKIAERFVICPQRFAGVDFSSQIASMDAAADVVVSMIDHLAGEMNLEVLSGLNTKLQAIEGEADKQLLAALTRIYNDAGLDPVTVIVLKDLYDLIEKVVDRCRDAGNVVTHIVLKNS